MDLYTPGYSLFALLAATLGGFIAGRVTGAYSDPRRREERKRQAREAAYSARENLDRLAPSTRLQVEKLVILGQKIEAIRAIREALGIGLKEAKDVADLISETSAQRGARAPE